MPEGSMGLRIATAVVIRRRADDEPALSDAHPMIIAAMQTDGMQAGDTVELKSGGPVMTVRARSQNLAYCAWTADGRLYQGTFEVGSLRRVRAAEPPPPASGP